MFARDRKGNCLTKRIKRWLALVLTVSMLFGNVSVAVSDTAVQPIPEPNAELTQDSMMMAGSPMLMAENTTYNIIIADSEHGTVTADKTTAAVVKRLF